MKLPDNWFSNKGQIFQSLAAMYALGQAAYSKFSDPHTPTWLIYGSVGIAVVVALGIILESRRQKKNENPLTLVDRDFVADERVEIEYKKKLYLTFRNDSDKTLSVGPDTVWHEGALHVRPLNAHAWRPEGPGGARNNDWGAEQYIVHVPPKRRVRTWIGLPNDAKKEVVMHTVSEQRAGTLTIPVATQTKVLKIKI